MFRKTLLAAGSGQQSYWIAEIEDGGYGGFAFFIGNAPYLGTRRGEIIKFDIDGSAIDQIEGDTNHTVGGMVADASYFYYVSEYDTQGLVRFANDFSAVVRRTYAISGASTVQGMQIHKEGSRLLVSGVTTFSSVNYHFLSSITTDLATVNWAYSFTGTAPAKTEGLATLSDSTIVFAGTDLNVNNQIQLIKTPSDCSAITWQRKITKTSVELYFPSIAVDSSDNIYVSTGASDGILRVLKYNSSGTLQWQRKISPDFYAGYGVTFDDSGNFYVAALDYGSDPERTVIFKYNSSGTLQWQRYFAWGTSGGNVATSPYTQYQGGIKWVDGALYVGGYVQDLPGGSPQYWSFLFKLPDDGSLTGTYTGTYGDYVYAASSYTDAAGDLTDSAGDSTRASITMTTSSASYTTNDPAFTTHLITL